MIFFRMFLKRRFLTLALLLASVVLLLGVSAAAQSSSNDNDDGNFNVYTSIFASGTSISAWASAPQPDSFEMWDDYDVIGQPSWSLEGGSYSDFGEGYSFSSGPIPLGSTYYASFYFYVEYYGQAAYSGESPSECVPGQLGDGDTCTGYDYPVGYASVYVPAPPPMITSLSTYSVPQGAQGNITLNGSYFVNHSGEYLALYITGGMGNPFTAVGQPQPCTTSCTATFSYDFSGFPAGTYTLTVANDESESDGKLFSIINTSGTGDNASKVLPVDPCAITSDPKSSFTSIIQSAATVGTGNLVISFSGPAYSNLSLTVPYGPSSTPSSVASNIAALVTRNYAQHGLIARALGPNIIYSAISTLGMVNVTGSSSFATDPSAAAANRAAVACYALPKIPCVGWFPNYDYTKTYSDGTTETPRQHIIRKHILGTPTASPRNTVYVDNYGQPTAVTFFDVQGYNFQTVISGQDTTPPGANYRSYRKTFPIKTLPSGAEFGVIGKDAAGNELYTNRLYLSADKCKVDSSFPDAP